MTRNEMMKGLNQPDAFVFSAVRIEGESVATSDLRRPSQRDPNFGVTNLNYDLSGLLDRPGAPS